MFILSVIIPIRCRYIITLDLLHYTRVIYRLHIPRTFYLLSPYIIDPHSFVHVPSLLSISARSGYLYLYLYPYSFLIPYRFNCRRASPILSPCHVVYPRVLCLLAIGFEYKAALQAHLLCLR